MRQRRPAKRALTKDLKPAALLQRYHRRTRRGVPWLQTLALALLLPLLSFASRVRIRGREHIPDGGYIAAANHLPVYLDGTRSLYTPWRWPKVRVVIGAPLHVRAIAQPSREQSQQTAQRILDAVYDLGRE